MYRVILNYKQELPDGDIVHMRIWQVQPNPQYPEGKRYSLVYIRNGERLVGYDNYHGKGHHRHLKEREEYHEFVDIQKLLDDFGKDMDEVSRGVIA